MLDSKVLVKKNSLTVQVLVEGLCGKNNLVFHMEGLFCQDTISVPVITH